MWLLGVPHRDSVPIAMHTVWPPVVPNEVRGRRELSVDEWLALPEDDASSFPATSRHLGPARSSLLLTFWWRS